MKTLILSILLFAASPELFEITVIKDNKETIYLVENESDFELINKSIIFLQSDTIKADCILIKKIK